MVTGTVGPGMGVMCASFVGCDKMIATLCFTLGMALMGFCYPSIRINSLDLSPNYAPTIMALVNGIGCLSGMATPYVAGILTPNVSIWTILYMRCSLPTMILSLDWFIKFKINLILYIYILSF